MGTPAPVTCLPRTHKRCLRGGCFAERKITTRGTSAHRTQSAVPSWRMFCRKGRLPREGTSAHRTQPAVPPWRMFCRKGRLPRGGTSRSVSGEETSRQGLRFRLEKCHGEAPPPALRVTQQMSCLKAIKGKRDPRRSLHYPPHHQTPAADETKT